MTILIECTEDTNNITLHTNDIIVHNESVTLSDLRSLAVDISDFGVDTKLQFFIIFLNTDLRRGEQYLLKIKFKGNLNDDLAGFYRNSYKNDSGQKRQGHFCFLYALQGYS